MKTALFLSILVLNFNLFANRCVDNPYIKGSMSSAGKSNETKIGCGPTIDQSMPESAKFLQDFMADPEVEILLAVLERGFGYRFVGIERTKEELKDLNDRFNILLRKGYSRNAGYCVLEISRPDFATKFDLPPANRSLEEKIECEN